MKKTKNKRRLNEWRKRQTAVKCYGEKVSYERKARKSKNRKSKITSFSNQIIFFIAIVLNNWVIDHEMAGSFDLCFMNSRIFLGYFSTKLSMSYAYYLAAWILMKRKRICTVRLVKCSAWLKDPWKIIDCCVVFMMWR